MEGIGSVPVCRTFQQFATATERLRQLFHVFGRDTDPRIRSRIANFWTAAPFYFSVSSAGID